MCIYKAPTKAIKWASIILPKQQLKGSSKNKKIV